MSKNCLISGKQGRSWWDVAFHLGLHCLLRSVCPNMYSKYWMHLFYKWTMKALIRGDVQAFIAYTELQIREVSTWYFSYLSTKICCGYSLLIRSFQQGACQGTYNEYHYVFMEKWEKYQHLQLGEKTTTKNPPYLELCTCMQWIIFSCCECKNSEVWSVSCSREVVSKHGPVIGQ